MKKYEPWGWYPNIQISIETIWVSKLNNKISGSLRNVQPMPLTSCRRLTQASEPITALTSSVLLFQHWSTSNSNNQWTGLRRYLLPADGNVRRRPTTVDRRPFPFQGGRQILTSKWEWSQTIFNPLHVYRQQMQADTGQQAAAFSTTRRRRS